MQKNIEIVQKHCYYSWKIVDFGNGTNINDVVEL